MSVACDAGQSAELELELGLVVVDGDGEETQAMVALQAKVQALEQQVNAIKVQQLLVQLQQGDAQQRMVEQLERMQQQQQQQQQQVELMSEEAHFERLREAMERTSEGAFDHFYSAYVGAATQKFSSQAFVQTVLRSSMHGEPEFIPNNYFLFVCCRSFACNEFGCKPFRHALAKQLRTLTGMEPSLVQKMNKEGKLQWAVESLR
ncbi:hypothetical protein FOA52_016170 [Chlamydomonas sp. UWO 241]|nr:hypothetical protein FOA52_016170 [Chlamydomonas sp. UWO 241]